MSIISVLIHSLILSLLIYDTIVRVIKLSSCKDADKHTQYANYISIAIFLYGLVLTCMGAFHVCH